MKKNRSATLLGKRIDGIVFDVDGTLVDSIDVYYDVFCEATERCGLHVEKSAISESMATATHIWDRTIPEHIENREEKIKEIAKIITEIFPERIEHARPFPGVAPLLEMLWKCGVKIGAFTSSWASVLRPLYIHSFGHYFDATLSREDGIKTKPAPDGILECLKRMQIDAGHAVAIGDSIVDIRAGRAAGTMTVGVLTGVASRTQLEAESPTCIVEGLMDLITLLDSRGNGR